MGCSQSSPPQTSSESAKSAISPRVPAETSVKAIASQDNAKVPVPVPATASVTSPTQPVVSEVERINQQSTEKSLPVQSTMVKDLGSARAESDTSNQTCTPDGVCSVGDEVIVSPNASAEAAREFKTAVFRCAGINTCENDSDIKLEDFFKEIDTNNDGILDQEEIDGFIKKVQLEISPKYRDILQTQMKELLIGFVGTPFSDLLKKFTEYEMAALVSSKPKRIVFVGGTGAGKSLLCTVLTVTIIFFHPINAYNAFFRPLATQGQDINSSEFKVGNNPSSETSACKSKVYRWFGDGNEEEFVCIDTPGLDDEKGRDEEHMNMIIEALKESKYVNTIVFVINGTNIRFSASMQKMIKKFEDSFTSRFYKHCVLCLTKWSMDKDSVEEREESGQSEDSWAQLLNQKIRDSPDLDCNVELPVIFVDSKYQRKDPEGGKDRLRKIQQISSLKVFRTEELLKVCPQIVKITNLSQQLQTNSPISPMEAATLDPEVKVLEWSIEPELPDGLAFCPAGGVLSGTPTSTAPLKTYEVFARSIGGLSEAFKLDLEVIHSHADVQKLVFKSMQPISEQLDKALLEETATASEEEAAMQKVSLAREDGEKLLQEQIAELEAAHGEISTFQSIVEELKSKFDYEFIVLEKRFLEFNQHLLKVEHGKQAAENDLKVILLQKTTNVKRLANLLRLASESGADPELIATGKSWLESIFLCPCKHNAHGCNIIKMQRDIASHEKVCLFGLPLLSKASAVGIPGAPSKTPSSIIVEANSDEKSSWAGTYEFDDGEYYLMNQDEERLQRIRPAVEKSAVGEDALEWVLTAQTEQDGPQAEIAKSSNSSISVLDAAFDGFSLSLPMTYKWVDSPTYVKCAKSSVKLIYFGGKWCPYCPPFTAKLAKFYKSIVSQKGPEALQIIFCSSDSDEKAMFEYYMGEHGDWLAIPYKERGLKEALSQTYSVRGIPSCILINNSMENITDSLDIRSLLGEISTTSGSTQDEDALRMFNKLANQVAIKSIAPSESLSDNVDIFCSLRFGKSMAEAKLVQQRLRDEHKLNAVIINVPEGEDIADQVAKKLDEAKLVLIFGCETYGVGTVSFSTKEELQFVLSEKKPFFLIKMCDRFKEARTRMALHEGIMYTAWKHGDPIPETLVADIARRFNTLDENPFSDSA